MAVDTGVKVYVAKIGTYSNYKSVGQMMKSKSYQRFTLKNRQAFYNFLQTLISLKVFISYRRSFFQVLLSTAVFFRFKQVPFSLLNQEILIQTRFYAVNLKMEKVGNSLM